MSVFSPRDRRTLYEMLSTLRRPISLMVFVDPKNDGQAAHDLVQELHELAPELLQYRVISVDETSIVAKTLSVTETPSWRFLGSAGELVPVEIIGMPTGYQFGSFLNLLLTLSQGHLHLGHSVHGALKNIASDVLIEVLVSATCPNCPEVVRMAQECALANPARIFSRTLDAGQHPHGIPPGLEIVPYTRIVVGGRVEAARAGMMSHRELWRLIQTGLKGATLA